MINKKREKKIADNIFEWIPEDTSICTIEMENTKNKTISARDLSIDNGCFSFFFLVPDYYSINSVPLHFFFSFYSSSEYNGLPFQKH